MEVGSTQRGGELIPMRGEVGGTEQWEGSREKGTAVVARCRNTSTGQVYIGFPYAASITRNDVFLISLRMYLFNVFFPI